MFPNHFVGRGAGWRTRLHAAANDALLGALVDVEPQSVSCGRDRGVRYVLLHFRRAGTRLTLRLSGAVQLPSSISAVGWDGERFEIRDIRYRRVGEDAVPVAWATSDHAVSFSTIARMRAEEPALPAGRAWIGGPTIIPTFAGLRPNQTTIRVVIEEKPYRFLLDSGANFTLVHPGLARHLALAHLTPAGILQATGPKPAAVAFIPLIRVGAVRIKDDPVLVAADTLGYDGLLGLSLFSLGRIRIEPHQLVLSPSLPAASAAGVARLDTYDGAPIASAHVGSGRVRALLDTGAAFEALFPFRVSHSATLLARSSPLCRIAGAAPWIAGLYLVPDFVLGNRTRPLHACVSMLDEVTPMPFPFNAVVGHQILMKPGSIFDYRAGTFTLSTSKSNAQS
ncbi:MAG: aspartyl protease family protein [Candidatus Eremiobacteraeota bacterium]|nr:aspartyl protease family protein [Candidatus Eremiobacteraeota bacterium]